MVHVFGCSAIRTSLQKRSVFWFLAVLALLFYVFPSSIVHLAQAFFHLRGAHNPAAILERIGDYPPATQFGPGEVVNCILLYLVITVTNDLAQP